MTPAGAIVIGYCRVSTDEQGQEGVSLDAQEHALSEYATARGWRLRVVREVASGKTMAKRPGMKESLAALEAGEAQALIVTKLDRLSRSVPDAFYVLNTANARGWDLVVMDMNLDTTTAMGKAMFGMAAVFAQLYRDQISDNTKTALAQKRRAGATLGRPRSMPEGTIIRLRELRDAKLSLQAISDALNVEGIRSTMGPAREDETPRRWFKQSVGLAMRRYLA